MIMKKIVLCGATHGSNFGDTMFGIMFYEYIHLRYPEIEIYYTKVSDYFNTWQKNSKTVDSEWKDIDGLIFISGGYFGDSPSESYKNSFFRFMNYVRFGLRAKLKKIPVAIIGIGAGPIKNSMLRHMIISIFNYARVISVRDKQSYQFLKSNGCKKEIIITSDSAQAIRRFGFSKEKCSSICEFSVNKKKLLVHCPTMYVKEYVEKVICAVDKLYKDCVYMDVYFCNDSKVEEGELKKISSAFTGNNKKYYIYNDPLEFIQFLKEMDMIITPKLHVGIFAVSFEKSVLSFPIHPGKTQRYYQQIGYSERCIPLSETNQEDVCKLITQYMDNSIHLSETIYAKAIKNFEMLDGFINNI